MANVAAGTMPRKPGDTYDTPTARCGMCGATCADNELKAMVDLYLKVAVGEPMPVGACPVCAGLCHPIDESDVRSVPVEMRKSFWTPFPKRIALDGELISCTATAARHMLFLIQNFSDIQVKELVERAVEIAGSENRRLSAIHLAAAYAEKHGSGGRANGA